jgi:hypothetical protein
VKAHPGFLAGVDLGQADGGPPDEGVAESVDEELARLRDVNVVEDEGGASGEFAVGEVRDAGGRGVEEAVDDFREAVLGTGVRQCVLGGVGGAGRGTRDLFRGGDDAASVEDEC